MRSTIAVTSLSIAALVFAAGPGFAVADEDKGTVKERSSRRPTRRATRSRTRHMTSRPA